MFINICGFLDFLSPLEREKSLFLYKCFRQECSGGTDRAQGNHTPSVPEARWRIWPYRKKTLECDNASEKDWEFVSQIHGSHSLKAVGSDQHAYYCFHCGAWNSGGPLRTFKAPCKGYVSQSRAYQHRLLSVGIIPKQGAKIPSHLKW